MKPSIPEVLPAFLAFYMDNQTWGGLHSVLADGNIRDHNVQSCLDSTEDEETARLAEILRRMSQTQRRKLPQKVYGVVNKRARGVLADMVRDMEAGVGIFTPDAIQERQEAREAALDLKTARGMLTALVAEEEWGLTPTIVDGVGIAIHDGVTISQEGFHITEPVMFLPRPLKG